MQTILQFLLDVDAAFQTTEYFSLTKVKKIRRKLFCSAVFLMSREFKFSSASKLARIEYIGLILQVLAVTTEINKVIP